MDRQDVVNMAEEGFEKVHGSGIWDKIAEHATDKTDAFKAGWRVGFDYALRSMEKGVIGMGPTNPQNN